MSRHRLSSCLCVSALLVLAAPWPSSAQLAKPASPPVIHASAHLVLVDVVVTRDGTSVQHLPQQRFHIYENGREQTLTSFEEHSASGAARIVPASALPPDVYSNRPQFAIDSAANVLLLDALNTPLADQQNARQQLLAYLKHMPAGTRLAVFTLGSRLEMACGFTTDAAALEAALTRKKNAAQSSALLESAQDQEQIGDAAAVMSGVDAGALQQYEAETQSYQTDERVRTTLDALDTLGRYLAEIPGRKNLIWFSGSFPVQIDFDPSLNSAASSASSTLTEGSAGEVSPLNPFSTMRDYAADVKAMDDLLAAARVAIYPVDARGVRTLASVDSSRDFSSVSPLGVSARRGRPPDSSSDSGDSAMGHADQQFLTEDMLEHLAMSQIAEETGGKVLANTNGLSQAAAEAIRNGSSYYTLGYVPAKEKWDGKFRRIEVRVDGGRYALAYRRGYFAEDPLQAVAPGMTAPIVAALERGAPPLSQIVFEARVLAASDPAAKAVKPHPGPAGETTLKPPVQRYLVDFSVDPHGLEWTAGPAGTAHAEFEVVMVAWDAAGKRMNHTDQGFSINLNAKQSAAVLKSGLPLHQEIDLPPGELYLHLAVHDLRNGRIGSMEIPVTVVRP